MGVISNIYTASAVAIIVGSSALYYVLLRKRNRSLGNGKPRKAAEAFNYLDINIITTVEDCDQVVHELRKRSMKHKTLGFDCEWVTEGSSRQPVSLLQLSSFDGYCGLFRLNCFTNGTMPNSLKELLKCEDVYKIGVAPDGDARHIRSDYQTIMRAVLDVRYIAEMWGYRVGGLAAMSEALLNVTLDKRWRTRCSDWEAVELTPAQIHYAASDAHAAIRMFVTLMETYNKGFRFWRFQSSHEDVWDQIDEICWQYSDLSYKAKQINNRPRIEGSKNDRKAKEKESRKQFRNHNHSTRSKPLYDNCYLQAPDGDLLCTCDTKKALWYLEKDLAVLISEDPLTVRLRFEPAGRATGDVGKYYKTKKENHCVVCGSSNSYIRKNIVPREYRKYFPEIMKDHSSHDILLLCVPCHKRSNMQDQVKRRHLAQICDAPIAHENRKVIEDACIKKVRMAARALLLHGRKHSLPIERRKELEAVVLSYYVDQDEVTDSMLQEASTMQKSETNEDFTAESHGFKVVSKYLASSEGLLKLEEEWRKHFLSTMRPMFMPELWSVDHNKDRLRVKWDEKRLSANELKAIGVEW